MNDYKISGTTATAYLAWVAGFIMIVVDLFVRADLGDLGLFIAGIGGVATIRRYLCKRDAAERNAFELGRDYEQHNVRALR